MVPSSLAVLLTEQDEETFSQVIRFWFAGLYLAQPIRMGQFYELYRNEFMILRCAAFVLDAQLIILSQTKPREERGFYLRIAIRAGWSKLDLKRQIKLALVERAVLTPGNN